MNHKYDWVLDTMSKVYWDVRDNIRREENVEELGKLLDRTRADLIDLMEKDEIEQA